MSKIVTRFVAWSYVACAVACVEDLAVLWATHTSQGMTVLICLLTLAVAGPRAFFHLSGRHVSDVMTRSRWPWSAWCAGAGMSAITASLIIQGHPHPLIGACGALTACIWLTSVDDWQAKRAQSNGMSSS